MANLWKKRLAASEIGEAGTHESGYVNIPKQNNTFVGTDQNAEAFYGKKPGLPIDGKRVFIPHVDRKTENIYNLRFEHAEKSNQIRLYELGDCVRARKPKVGDEIVVEKIHTSDGLLFVIDIIRDNESLKLKSKEEINKLFKRKKREVEISEEDKKHNFKINEEIKELRDKYRNGSIRNKSTNVEKAEIYEVTFEVENNKYIYVGQDSFCSDRYIGSSIVIKHYREVFGEKIFNKKILESFENIKQGSLNKEEQKHIRIAKDKASNNGYYCINYTGKR
jgi:hypothetical protein